MLVADIGAFHQAAEVGTAEDLIVDPQACQLLAHLAGLDAGQFGFFVVVLGEALRLVGEGFYAAGKVNQVLARITAQVCHAREHAAKLVDGQRKALQAGGHVFHGGLNLAVDFLKIAAHGRKGFAQRQQLRQALAALLVADIGAFHQAAEVGTAEDLIVDPQACQLLAHLAGLDAGQFGFFVVVLGEALRLVGEGFYAAGKVNQVLARITAQVCHAREHAAKLVDGQRKALQAGGHVFHGGLNLAVDFLKIAAHGRKGFAQRQQLRQALAALLVADIGSFHQAAEVGTAEDLRVDAQAGKLVTHLAGLYAGQLGFFVVVLGEALRLRHEGLHAAREAEELLTRIHAQVGHAAEHTAELVDGLAERLQAGQALQSVRDGFTGPLEGRKLALEGGGQVCGVAGEQCLDLGLVFGGVAREFDFELRGHAAERIARQLQGLRPGAGAVQHAHGAGRQRGGGFVAQGAEVGA